MHLVKELGPENSPKRTLMLLWLSKWNLRLTQKTQCVSHNRENWSNLKDFGLISVELRCIANMRDRSCPTLMIRKQSLRRRRLWHTCTVQHGQTRVAKRIHVYDTVPANTLPTGDMRAETPLTRQRKVPWDTPWRVADCQVYYITAARRRSRDFAALH